MNCRFLIDVFLSGKPLIDLEISMLQYSNAETTLVQLLKQKVAQEMLAKDVAETIIKELVTSIQTDSQKSKQHIYIYIYIGSLLLCRLLFVCRGQFQTLVSVWSSSKLASPSCKQRVVPLFKPWMWVIRPLVLIFYAFSFGPGPR